MKELYNSLYNQGLYTGTFEQFQSDYGGENYQELYNKLNIGNEIATPFRGLDKIDQIDELNVIYFKF